MHGSRTERAAAQGQGRQGIIHPTFRWQAANLLAFTKFVGNGLLIKCLPQVDLPAAPLNLLNYPLPSLPLGRCSFLLVECGWEG
ncbi:hypothetical protein K040078D81_09470 [Blautia hominis]|uniref:Uncharacterized protein n=1 Tax=Blautia hominis TaxID=2025493 RepID=A0ABQ0B5V0_9FIRM